MKAVSRVLAVLVMGPVVAFLAGWVVSLIIAPRPGALMAFIAIAFMIGVAWLAKSPGRAWGWGFVVSGLLCFLVPLSALVHTGTEVTRQTEAAAAIGAAAGGIMASVTWDLRRGAGHRALDPGDHSGCPKA